MVWPTARTMNERQNFPRTLTYATSEKLFSVWTQMQNFRYLLGSSPVGYVGSAGSVCISVR